MSEELHWIANTHGVFQGYYFFHYLGMDRDLRENYRGHPHFEACAEFCEKYDQSAFDPAYESAPLAFFEPMVARVFSRPINSIYAKWGRGEGGLSVGIAVPVSFNNLGTKQNRRPFGDGGRFCACRDD